MMRAIVVVVLVVMVIVYLNISNFVISSVDEKHNTVKRETQSIYTY